MCSDLVCAYMSDNPSDILNHSLQKHNISDNFKIRRKILNDTTGDRSYQSLEFSISLLDIGRYKQTGHTCYINIHEKRITFKKYPNATINNHDEKANQTDDDHVYKLIPGVIKKMKDMDRISDFISILQCIENGVLIRNIAFHLLLDIGRKGNKLFRGYKGDGLGDEKSSIGPKDCEINFAVPSNPIITKEVARFTADAGHPGILNLPLDAFAARQQGKDIKLSIDGKKIAIGFGEMGDEDLAGDEPPPTLEERKTHLSDEVLVVSTVKTVVETSVIDGFNKMTDFSDTNLSNAKQAFMVTILNMSNRIKELRELIVKRKIHLENLIKVVEGDWKTSKLANAISFWQTKIIHSQSIIKDLLECIDKLGFTIACINGTENNYVYGTNQIPLFLLIRKDDARITKQRSDSWLNLRKESRITGSTIFKALGLSTLKEQQRHFDKTYGGLTEAIPDELQTLFDYGTEQEINGIGTLVGKIIPVYFPSLILVEDGCEKIPIGDSYAIISGDGSGTTASNVNEMAFEIKCPVPGKKRTTDVHYKIPVYYTTQILSQMAAKKCNKIGYLSFTPESSTFITGSMDQALMNDIWELCTEIYGSASAVRPTKRNPISKELLERLNKYSTSCTFVGEFPSLQSKPCSCEPAQTKDGVYGCHSNGLKSFPLMPSLDDIASSLEKCTTALTDAYNILRKPAKEVLVTVASDLHRLTGGYAVPIQYGLGGFSLYMTSVRKMLTKAVDACYSRQMSVRVIAFDGQFLEISLANDFGKPLTICKFMRMYWADVVKMTKHDKLVKLLNNCCLPQIKSRDQLLSNFDINGRSIELKKKIKHVGSPNNIARVLQKSKKETCDMETLAAKQHDPELDILQYLPVDLINKMDVDAVNLVRLSGKSTAEKSSTSSLREIDTTESIDNTLAELYEPTEEDFVAVLIALLALDCDKDSSKWESMTVESLRLLFANADSVMFLTRTSLKAQLVNMVSHVYGDKSVLPERTRTPKPLKTLTENHIKAWTSDAVNVAYAQMHFFDAFREWDNSNMFNGSWDIRTDTGFHYHIPQWYAQPSEISSQIVQPIIDPHHLLVNNRSKCCSSGMINMGIQPEAWWKVAEKSVQNRTGLSVEIAKELRDRQSNAFAQTTFSHKVQLEMDKNGCHNEALWCELIRNWYSAIDCGGIPLHQRIRWFLDMRDYLLQFLKVGHFPPPGSHVEGMPMAQFEGFLTNVDRRLQLYALIDSNESYNQRAITSLDSETFFSAFQDYDPKGTGVLRPDDIPTALGAAQYLNVQRLNEDRHFVMRTSRRTRVYPERPLQENIPMEIDGTNLQAINPFERRLIIARRHVFDMEERKTKNPKRKSGTITPYGLPGKGAEGARSFHKTNEEKVLPHSRFGILDDELMEL
ncbi:unnamed protein product [Mytilus edulis]|uniref:YqaJ viral recombinase domain-containing protein n=1 Tax=Mytilus edulis TaxID=6550 RepID=A0A8S3Q2T8_MYTED|nr:unnamed protein product [Mytilus edulis]